MLFFFSRGGQPVPIEYLPAEHTLNSRVRLIMLFFFSRGGKPVPIEYLPTEHTLDSRVR